MFREAYSNVLHYLKYSLLGLLISQLLKIKKWRAMTFI